MTTQKSTILKLTLLILFLISHGVAISQQRGTQPHPPAPDKPNKPGKRIAEIHKTVSEKHNDLNIKKTSPEVKILTDKIRLSRKSGDKNLTHDLQSRLNSLNGVVTKQCNPVGFIKAGSGQLPQRDDIDVVQIFGDQNVQGIATATEQIGNNAGRIWTVVITNYSNKASYSQADFYYSDDNGINWFNYAFANNPYEIAAPDAIDAEIIEDYTGTKYLYVAYGAITISSGKYICNLITLTISGVAGGSVQRLEWPGFDYFNTDVAYYKPRITSDNAFWNGAAYLYIAACQDSSILGQQAFGEKVAFIDNPYTGTPGINYKSDIYWYWSYDNGIQQGRCDIAWFDDPGNGGGSVILVESGAYFTTAIYLYENADVNFLGLPTYEGYLDPDGLVKSDAHVASNGLYQNLMIVNVSEYDVSDHDIQYFSTDNAGTSWSDGFISYTFDDDYPADITGLRNVPGNYYSAHADFNFSFDNVFYSVARNSEWGDVVAPMNTLDASVEVSPKAGMKLSGDDSCFVIWSEYINNTGMYASSGCEGVPALARLLYLRLFIEGHYDPGDYEMTINDTIAVSIRNIFPPYNIVDSKKVLLYSNGYASMASNIVNTFTNYYIVVNFKNAIETWSSGNVNFSGPVYYDFVPDNAYAYGGNEKYLGTDPGLNNYYGIFSGDVNQDEFIDLTDLTLVFNNASSFVTGYVVTDVNGDEIVDLTDLTITYNNSNNFVSVMKP